MIVDRHGAQHFVFDTHVHVGPRALRSVFRDAPLGAEALLAEMDAAGVDMAVVFARAAPTTTYRRQNEYALSLQREHPDRFVAFARVNPSFGGTARRDIRDFAARGVRGLKIHPLIDGGANPVNDPASMGPLMEEAARHRLVVLIHSGAQPNCTPALVGDLAARYPDVDVIMGHSGYRDHYPEAVAAAARWPNLYLDVAGLSGPRVVRLVVESVGSDRVLFGSDHPVNPFAFELGKVVKYADLSTSQLGGVLGRNLARLLHLEPPVQPGPLVHATSL